MNEHPAGAVRHVDHHCTDCDVARHLAPELVAEVDGRSSVVRQPRTDAEDKALHAAAFACPGESARRMRDLTVRIGRLSPRPIDFTALRW
ncbi:ferredoxin [Microbispora rosea]|uniref:ferredoxin n=1 Tax=Microbispora rosea TaxID=58117 RepID=UPI003408C7FC